MLGDESKEANKSGGKKMKHSDIDFFRVMLQGQLQMLSTGTDKDLRQIAGTDDRMIEYLDRVAYEEIKGMQYKRLSRETKLMKKIKDTLERIENGTYGICNICGEEISLRRLKARPVTDKCIKCKIEEENLEKPRYYNG